MLHPITFNELSAMLVDFVDSGDGFLFLRIVGAEPTVNAIWAKLSGKEGRGKKWGSQVQIPIPGQSYPQYVAAQKRVPYRTVRTRLPSGMIDLALIHPVLTVAEDTQRGFHLLTYEDHLPTGFFDRLNKSLVIPLKPEWADWLWEQGQRPQTFLALESKAEWEQGKQVEKIILTETTKIPINRLTSLGTVRCYTVMCHGQYRTAWLQIIRHQLKLGIRLKAVPHVAGGGRYQNETWSIYHCILPDSHSWRLVRGDEVVLEASSLNYLVTQARDDLGLHFILEEEKQ